MRKTNSLERTLIDSLTFLTLFTILFAFSNLTIYGFIGVGARFSWYLTICICAILYHYFYYDASILKRILPGIKNFDPYLAAIPLLPLLIFVFIPADFPKTEYKFWFGLYVFFGWLLCMRHAGVYTYSIMKDLAKLLFIGSSVLMVMLHIVLMTDYLKDAVSIAFGYLLIPLISTVLLLHILRIERRTESFLKKEFTLLVVFLLAVAILYFSGIFTLLECGGEKILDALNNILRYLSQFFPKSDPKVFEPMTIPQQTDSTSETSTTNTFTFPTHTGTEPATTEWEPAPLKPLNYWYFVIPILFFLAWAIYTFTKKQMKRTNSDLFVEERERTPEDSVRKPSGRKFFQKKTPRERVRASYARFMKRLEHQTDTTENLASFTDKHISEPGKITSAERLTSTYRKARYLDTYEVTESDAKTTESDIRNIERKN